MEREREGGRENVKGREREREGERERERKEWRERESDRAYFHEGILNLIHTNISTDIKNKNEKRS